MEWYDIEISGCNANSRESGYRARSDATGFYDVLWEWEYLVALKGLLARSMALLTALEMTVGFVRKLY